MRSTEMGRQVTRCQSGLATPQQDPQSPTAPTDAQGESTQESTEESREESREALMKACATVFDHDANGVFSRLEVVALWRVLQQRAMDADLTSREFFMVLQVSSMC